MKKLLNTFIAILISISAFAQEPIKPGKFIYDKYSFVVKEHTAMPIYSIQRSPMKKILPNPESVQNLDSEQMDLLYNSIDIFFSVSYPVVIKRYFINQEELKKNKEYITIWFICAPDGYIIDLNFVVKSNTKMTTHDIGILYGKLMDSGVESGISSYKNLHKKLNHITFSRTYVF